MSPSAQEVRRMRPDGRTLEITGSAQHQRSHALYIREVLLHNLYLTWCLHQYRKWGGWGLMAEHWRLSDHCWASKVSCTMHPLHKRFMSSEFKSCEYPFHSKSYCYNLFLKWFDLFPDSYDVFKFVTSDLMFVILMVRAVDILIKFGL